LTCTHLRRRCSEASYAKGHANGLGTWIRVSTLTLVKPASVFGHYGDLPAEKAIVGRMRQLRRKAINGRRLSFAAIASQLNAEGHRNRAGREWSSQLVYHVLNRPRHLLRIRNSDSRPSIPNLLRRFECRASTRRCASSHSPRSHRGRCARGVRSQAMSCGTRSKRLAALLYGGGRPRRTGVPSAAEVADPARHFSCVEAANDHIEGLRPSAPTQAINSRFRKNGGLDGWARQRLSLGLETHCRGMSFAAI
jgi:hypothetical protein